MDKYERLKVLGSGAFGTAVLVRERRSSGQGQLQVVKEIDLERMSTALRQAAQGEADVLQSLSHINIIAYYSAFIEASKLHIVMEFADGGDLATDLRQRRAEGSSFIEDEVLAIFMQCCLALQHIHARHVLHRDLKCQNIFLTKGRVVKLGDFGIAKVLDNTCAEAMTVIGTPRYLPPEIVDNKPYGIKADIWSLGVVLYELLTLEPPFQGRCLAALVVKIVTADPKPIAPGRHSEEVRGMVTSCLQKRPEFRPSTAELLATPMLRHGVGLLPPCVSESLRSAQQGQEGQCGCLGARNRHGLEFQQMPERRHTNATSSSSSRPSSSSFDTGCDKGDAVDKFLFSGRTSAKGQSRTEHASSGGIERTIHDQATVPDLGAKSRRRTASEEEEERQARADAEEFLARFSAGERHHRNGDGISGSEGDRAHEQRRLVEKRQCEALQSRSDAKAIQSKMRSKQNTDSSHVPLTARSREHVHVAARTATSVRRRSSLPKEEQRLRRERELDEARLAAREVNRELRSVHQGSLPSTPRGAPSSARGGGSRIVSSIAVAEVPSGYLLGRFDAPGGERSPSGQSQPRGNTAVGGRNPWDPSPSESRHCAGRVGPSAMSLVGGLLTARQSPVVADARQAPIDNACVADQAASRICSFVDPVSAAAASGYGAPDAALPSLSGASRACSSEATQLPQSSQVVDLADFGFPDDAAVHDCVIETSHPCASPPPVIKSALDQTPDWTKSLEGVHDCDSRLDFFEDTSSDSWDVTEAVAEQVRNTLDYSLSLSFSAMAGSQAAF